MTNDKFYTYAYCDKNIKGIFEYDGLIFNYLPRYIGKGMGNRVYEINAHQKHNIGLSFMNTEDIEIIFIDKNLTEEEAFEKEIEYISLIGRLNLEEGSLFNKTSGGDGMSGFKHSKKTKQKMKNNHAGMLGKKHSQETIAKMKENVPWNKGKNISQETKNKISKNHSKYWEGKQRSVETKNKISKSKKGTVPWMFGKKHSMEAKEKMSEAGKGRHHTEETKKKISEKMKLIMKEKYGT